MRLLKTLISYLLGEACVGCGAPGVCLCESCCDGLPFMPGERCVVCSAPGPALCERCKIYPMYRTIRAAAPYEGTVAAAIRALKYRSMASLAEPLGKLMASRLADTMGNVDILVAVPLSDRRQRERGFNQAERLGHYLALAWSVPLVPGLVRLRHTERQTNLHADARARNVQGAFGWKGHPLDGISVGLVDDVATTGATIAAGAEALVRSGAARVVGLVLAREGTGKVPQR